MIPIGAGAVGKKTVKAPAYDQLYKTGFNYAYYGIPQDTWMSYGGPTYTKPIAAGAEAARNMFAPAALPGATGGGGGGGGGYAPSSFNMPSFEPPPVPMLSLDEMMDIINRRVGLMIDPQIEGLRRGIEEERVAHESRVGETKAGYEEARGQLEKMAQAHQRQGADTMARRGLYDSGMAVDLANRIQRQTAEHGLKLENEQARILADLAEYLATRERHTTEQIEGLEGRRGEWVQSLLDEMQQRERDRQDRLEQQAFENWLSQTAMEQQIWQANQAAAAAASRGSAPSGPNYGDILKQMELAAIMSLPAQQQQRYLLLGPQALSPQQSSFDDWLNQQRMSNIGRLSEDQLMRYLFGVYN